MSIQPESSNTPPVCPTETLLRQIIPGGNPLWYDPDCTKPTIHFTAFLPHKHDTDGLSLIRAYYRSRPWAAYRPNKPESRNRLATLSARRLGELAVDNGLPGCDFAPSPDDLDSQHPEPWAHCVAIQINRTEYEADLDTRNHIRQWARAVADSLTAAQIEGPFVPPAADEPYRPTAG